MFHSACPASLKPAASCTRGSGVSSAIIASMRLISAVWSATTSDVNPKSTESWAAPGWRSRFSTMVTAPRWCLIISSRKSRSKAAPSASPRLAISSAVSMPGIGWKPSAWCASTAVTSWPRSRSQSCIISISSSCESSMRSAVARMASLAVLVSSSAVISRAWAWCEIMPCMNRTSASLNRMPARSEASVAEMVRLGSPGAPGCTMGGCAGDDAAPSVRNAMPAARAAATSGRERFCRVMK